MIHILSQSVNMTLEWMPDDSFDGKLNHWPQGDSNLILGR